MGKKKATNELKFTASLLVFLLSVFFAYTIKLWENPPLDLIAYQPNLETSIVSDEGILNIHYIDVGQADSILVTLNDKAMLIDAGNNDTENTVINYLHSQGISRLDYVIATHPHADHIGEMHDIIMNFEIEKFLMPNVTNGDLFEKMLDALIEKNVLTTNPEIGDMFEFSTAEFTVLSCKNEDTNDLNTASIVIRLVFGEESYIFCADAEKENEYAMMDSGLTLKSSVIKIGHHGSTTSSLEKFITAVDPEIAIISVGANNSYGHPHEKIVKRLNRLGIKTYRTDINGTIVITSNGKNNTVTVSKGE